MNNQNSDDMELENLIFTVDNLGKGAEQPKNTSAPNFDNIDSYYMRYKLGISESDLDSMCPQEKLDFCDYISKWPWGTSGSFFIGISFSTSTTQENQQTRRSIVDVEKDIVYLSKIFPYKIIVYFAGESTCDYCSKVFFAGACEKFVTIPAIEINQLLHIYGICLRPLELFYRDPEFVDLDSIDICDF